MRYDQQIFNACISAQLTLFIEQWLIVVLFDWLLVIMWIGCSIEHAHHLTNRKLFAAHSVVLTKSSSFSEAIHPTVSHSSPESRRSERFSRCADYLLLIPNTSSTGYDGCVFVCIKCLEHIVQCSHCA